MRKKVQHRLSKILLFSFAFNLLCFAEAFAQSDGNYDADECKGYFGLPSGEPPLPLLSLKKIQLYSKDSLYSVRLQFFLYQGRLEFWISAAKDKQISVVNNTTMQIYFKEGAAIKIPVICIQGNCDRGFNAMIGPEFSNEDYLKTLQTLKIDFLELEFADRYVNMYLTSRQAELVLQTLRCMLNYKQ